ncbi:PQQ-dependent sugar dehydrogenase [Pedobacter faecalis]|uniref:PQQ-dependent sugar dehydrogenase n=1 Tax=Pedobacter faecalis TaxID=3041495 RepID=UPI00254A73B9|nr:PQQ-dependent sugar dehydrogenase [Pedobacter sp. ELA7]
MKQLVILLLVSFCVLGCKKSKSPGPVEELPDAEIKTRVVSSGLSHVWEMIYGPDDHLWVTERSGKISRVNVQSGAVSLVYTLTDVVATGEGGLLGMALHPQFSTTPWVYLVYNYGSPYREKVVRFVYHNNTLTSPSVVIDGIPAGSVHNGSRLLITSDQKLLVTTGDAGNGAAAQNIQSLSGKILRFNLDGSIPSDNPVAGSPVWTLGHRNPQGLTEGNGRIYASEHGPNNDDEINIIGKGANYGWPNVEGYCDKSNEGGFCTANNVAEPIMAWTPTIAVCGLLYYNSDYIPQWRNALLLVTLKGSKMLQLTLNEAGDKIVDTQEYFVNAYGRLRAICSSPDGKVYIASSNGNADKIIEVGK